MSVTRDDVAGRAGVSSATVSRVYNEPDSVSPERQDAVLAAADALGYVPDKNASALRRSGVGKLVLLDQATAGRDSEGTRSYRWFYSDMMHGIRGVVDRSMYQLAVLSPMSAGELRRVPKSVLGDGVIHPGFTDTARIKALAARGCPYVCCGQSDAPDGINACYTDNTLGGETAARVFIEAGRTKPAHITGRLESTGACQLRWAGFRQGWQGRRIRLIDGELGVQGGFRSARRLVRSIRAGRVDCIFVVNDLTAVGVIQGLADAGVRVPQDVSLIGYDNLPFIDVLPMRPATIDIAFDRVYARATELLIESIRTGDAIRERVEPRYVPGETV